jgi:hypothetical protein
MGDGDGLGLRAFRHQGCDGDAQGQKADTAHSVKRLSLRHGEILLLFFQL